MYADTSSSLSIAIFLLLKPRFCSNETGSLLGRLHNDYCRDSDPLASPEACSSTSSIGSRYLEILLFGAGISETLAIVALGCVIAYCPMPGRLVFVPSWFPLASSGTRRWACLQLYSMTVLTVSFHCFELPLVVWHNLVDRLHVHSRSLYLLFVAH